MESDADDRIVCPNYKSLIIDMVEEIKNPGILEYLYTFIKLFLEKWG